ncbi:MAG: FadR/GntR family transcriptional regulator [Thermodesulfobacteriota bacterium]|jgi:DNA-binding FadR family transcriptional regulator
MEELKFESLPISKTSELIEKEIEKAILIKRLKPGDKLPTEKKMAEQFGVSLVTLREALRGLEIFGLIEKRKGQRGGVFISEIDNQSIKGSLGHFLSFKELSPQHLYEVRRIIEPPAIKLAVQKISPDEIRKLEENVSYCEGMLNGMGQQINVQQFYALDDRNNDFHRLIAAGSHNPILSLTVDYVLDFLKGCETTFLVPDIKYSMDNVQDHKNILGYLKKRDAEMCEKEMILHLKKLDEYLIALESKQIGSESNLYGLNDR